MYALFLISYILFYLSHIHFCDHQTAMDTAFCIYWEHLCDIKTVLMIRNNYMGVTNTTNYKKSGKG